jgi:hypothetical protein
LACMCADLTHPEDISLVAAIRKRGRPVTNVDPRNVKRREARKKLKAARETSGLSSESFKLGRGRPRHSQSAAALRRNQLTDEIKAAERALQDVAMKLPGAAAVFAAALETPGGKKAFPELAKASVDTTTAQNIASAVVGALGELSERPARRTLKSKVIAAGVEPAPSAISGVATQPLPTQTGNVSKRASLR